MSTVTYSIPILGLDFSRGAALSVEHVLEMVDGVVKVHVNSATATAYVNVDSDRTLVKNVVRAIEECGYETSVAHLPEWREWCNNV